jgi:DNA repair protein RadC
LSARYGTLAELLSAEPLIVAQDVGQSAADALTGARELMIEAAADELLKRSPLRSPAEAADFLKALIGFRCDECLIALYLDARHGLIDHEIVAVGRPDAVQPEPRQILLRAICRGATAIIIAHNHPSGDPAPSTSDIRFTRDFADACRGLGIHLCDHLVVAGGQVQSALYGS